MNGHIPLLVLLRPICPIKTVVPTPALTFLASLSTCIAPVPLVPVELPSLRQVAVAGIGTGGLEP